MLSTPTRRQFLAGASLALAGRASSQPVCSPTRAGDYKLIEFYEDGWLELYNLAKDVGESDDLSRRDPNRTAKLHAMLKTWREAVGAVMPVKNPKYDPATADEHLSGENPRPAR
jgi:hypothetical protein